MKRCLYCGDLLRFEPGRGWVHSEGGTYRVRCGNCGWEGAPFPTPTHCPRCGSRDVRDDHCATPVEAKGGAA